MRMSAGQYTAQATGIGRLTGKVAFITGAARGQGRSHALRLAGEGADIIAMDLCAQIDTVNYPLGARAELDETVAKVEGLGRKLVATVGDVRIRADVAAALAAGLEVLGHLDVVVANAGIFPGPGDRCATRSWTRPTWISSVSSTRLP
jgi:NAD(P)-dependent dehydrogenase (short-subunit alcohol dehydrogenase family)